MDEKEYISREAAIEEFSNNGSIFVYGKPQCKAIVSRLNSIPAADVRPVVRGRWEEANVSVAGSVRYFSYKCSACQKHEGWRTRFCPNCGADMREGSDGLL